jgi:hypothetical protein
MHLLAVSIAVEVGTKAAVVRNIRPRIALEPPLVA